MSDETPPPELLEFDVYGDSKTKKLGSTSWADLQSMADAFFSLLAAVPGGPSKQEVFPTALVNGSTGVRSVTNRTKGEAALAQVRHGDRTLWSPAARRAARELARVVRQTGFDGMSVGRERRDRQPVDLEVPAIVATTTGTVVGQLFKLGGKSGDRLYLQPDAKGQPEITAHVSRSLTEQLCSHLHKRMSVRLRMKRDIDTGKTLEAEVLAFELLPDIGDQTDLMKFRERLAKRGRKVDVRAIVKKVRG